MEVGRLRTPVPLIGALTECLSDRILGVGLGVVVQGTFDGDASGGEPCCGVGREAGTGRGGLAWSAGDGEVPDRRKQAVEERLVSWVSATQPEWAPSGPT